jgi:putative aldouronate transport system permease protein
MYLYVVILNPFGTKNNPCNVIFAGSLIEYIRTPSISPVVILLLILRIGNLMNAGFEQIQVMLNDYTRPVIDIFDTFVYRRGIQRGDYSYATAVGLFNSVVSLILIVIADRLAKTFGGKAFYNDI